MPPSPIRSAELNASFRRVGQTADGSSSALRGEQTLRARQILLIIGGGIAAYKILDLIRRLRERGMAVRVVMTRAAQEFVTPLSAGAIAGERAFTDLFDPARSSTSATSGWRATPISSSSRPPPPT